MPDQSALRAASDEEIAALIAAALRDSGGGRLTREADGYLAGVCAERLHERLLAAGVVFLLRAE